jgi:O-antigen/teichoic acid export membrane protein
VTGTHAMHRSAALTRPPAGPGAPPLDAPAAPSADASLRRLARGSTANLAGTAVSAFANFALIVVLTRGLPQSTAGVFISMTSVFIIATVLGQLGASTGLVYFLVRAMAAGRRDEIAGYMRTAWRAVLVTAVGMAVVAAVAAPWLAAHATPEHASAATRYLLVLALFIPLAGAENVALAGTRGLGSMRANALVEFVGRPTLQVLLVLAVVALGADGWVAWAWALPYLPAAVLAWWWWRRQARGMGLSLTVTRPVPVREFWTYSAPRAVTSVVQIVMQRLDIVLVAALAGPAQAAIYAAATRFVVAGQMGNNAISLAAQPRLADTMARGDQPALAEIYRTSTAWLIAVTWPLHLTFIVSGELLLHIFGSGYGVGAPVMLVLASCMLVSTGIGMADTVLLMAGRTSWSLGNAAVSLAVQIGLDLWLIPRHGVLGAAIGWGAAILLRNGAALVQVVVSDRVHSISRQTLISAAINVVSFGAIPLLAQLVLGRTWPALVLGLVVGGALYVAALWRFRGVLRLRALKALSNRGRGAGRPGGGAAPGGVAPDGAAPGGAAPGGAAPGGAAPGGLARGGSPAGAPRPTGGRGGRRSRGRHAA